MIQHGQHVLVTGGAGFIGSTLVDRLLKEGCRVTVCDNLSTGHVRFLSESRDKEGFRFLEGDLLDLPFLTRAMEGVDFVFHLAANADVRFGLQHPRKDLEQNTMATFNVLEAMRANQVRKVAFSSTGSIYGEAKTIPTPEDAPFPVQTSLYGASKLAGEGLIQAYAEGYQFQGWIFRFVSILGNRYTHGHIYDFYKKLLHDPARLEVLGNGGQRKSYLHVDDCVEAMLTALSRSNEKVNIFNLGADEYCQVTDSIGWITNHLKLHPKLEFTGGERGWIGDNPFIFLESSKIRKLGWMPRYSIKEAVLNTLSFLQENQWIFEGRAS